MQEIFDIAPVKHHFGQFDPPDAGIYAWDCETYITLPLARKKGTNCVEVLAIDDPVVLTLKRIKNTLDYIILFRDKWAGLKAEQLLGALPLVLDMDVVARDKAQLIRNRCLDWATWMQLVYPGADLLRDECCSWAAELVMCYLIKASAG